ncbi:putative heavy metal-associated domain superfamily [Helianthus anomalus]
MKDRNYQLAIILQNHGSSNAFVTFQIIELGVSFNNQSEIYTIENAVSSLVGVESVSSQKDTGRLIVVGCVDPIEVVSCVRELGNMAVKVLSVKYKIE